MKKRVLWLCTLAVLVFIAMGCDNAATNDNNEEPFEGTLTGTSWKLIAVVDAANNVSREPGYGERGWRYDVYTITFGDSGYLWGRSERNSIYGQYHTDYDADILFLHDVMTTAVCCDWGDGMLYSSVFVGINCSRSFKLYSQHLHIFYNDGKEYLKFNKIE